MKVIVCGAGQVGYNIARHLAAEGNAVTVIDQASELVKRITDTLDVQGVTGFASHPDVLAAAGAADCDMVVAVTLSDEVNMVACQVAQSLFNVPTRIARVRAQSYLNPAHADLFGRGHIPIDVIISPEFEVARAIARRLAVPGATDLIPFAADKVQVFAVRCGSDCPLVHTHIKQLPNLFPDLRMAVIGLIRGEGFLVPGSEDQIFPGDEAYVVTATPHLKRALAAFGQQPASDTRRVLILGGGNVGLYLAQQLEQEAPEIKAKIVEADRAKAERLADSLARTVVLHGDALDSEVLTEANVKACEAVVAVTNDDEVNVLSSLLAKRAGARRAITLVNSSNYFGLLPSLGIDVVVNPRTITVSTILQHVRRGRIRGLHSLRDGMAEIIDAEALATTSLVGTPLGGAKIPAGIAVGAIVRGEEVIIPDADTVIKAQDRVIMIADREAVRKVERMFSVRLEYF